MTRTTKRTGFTLLELLLVIFIIGVLAALAVGRFGGYRERAGTTATAVQIKSFSGALERYKLDMGNYPTTEEELRALVVKPDDEEKVKNWPAGGYIEDIPKDPWGHDYIYKCPGEHHEETYDIISSGPDGDEGTEDDIKNWKDEEY